MSGIEGLTHAQLREIVHGEAPWGLGECGHRLSDMAPLLSEVAEDIHRRMGELAWEGDSADQFRAWADHFREQSTVLGEYAMAMGKALRGMEVALASARGSMPEEPPLVLETVRSGAFGIEQTPHDEAVAVVRRLSSFYELATQRLTTTEEPQFALPSVIQDKMPEPPDDSVPLPTGPWLERDDEGESHLPPRPGAIVPTEVPPLSGNHVIEQGTASSPVRETVPTKWSPPAGDSDRVGTSLDSVAGPPVEDLHVDPASPGGEERSPATGPTGRGSVGPVDRVPIVPVGESRRPVADTPSARPGGGSGRSVVGGVPGVSGPGVGRQVVPPGGLGGVPPRGVVGGVPRQPDGGARRAVPGGVVGRGVGSAVRDPVTGAVRGPGGGLVRRSAKKDPPGASFVSGGPVARGGDESVDPPGVTGRPRETRRKRRRVVEGESSESERDTSR